MHPCLPYLPYLGVCLHTLYIYPYQPLVCFLSTLLSTVPFGTFGASYALPGLSASVEISSFTDHNNIKVPRGVQLTTLISQPFLSLGPSALRFTLPRSRRLPSLIRSLPALIVRLRPRINIFSCLWIATASGRSDIFPPSLRLESCFLKFLSFLALKP